MTARAWLPPCADAFETLRGLIEPAVSAWGARWFATGEARLSEDRTGEAGEGMVRWTGAAAEVGLTSVMRTRLWQTVLDSHVSEASLTEADRGLVFGLVEAVAQDLLTDIEQSLTIPRGSAETFADPNGAASPTLGAVVSRGRDRLAVLFIPHAAITAAQLYALGAARQPYRGTLASHDRALGPTRVALEAGLGQAVVSLADLGGLAVDDVLVLDQPIENGVAVALCGAHTPFAWGQLSRTDTHLAITLQSPRERTA